MSPRRAAELVERGSAVWWKRRNVNHGFIPVRDAIALIEEPVPIESHPLHARLVSDGDVVNAYVQDVRIEQERIERIGQSEVAALVALGAQPKQRKE